MRVRAPSDRTKGPLILFSDMEIGSCQILAGFSILILLKGKHETSDRNAFGRKSKNKRSNIPFGAPHPHQIRI